MRYQSTHNGEDGKMRRYYQHFAVYAGKDSKGNIYLMTKDGDKMTPKVRKATEWEDDQDTIWDFFLQIEQEK